MNRFIIVILILLSLCTGSCSSRKKKLDKRNLIPEKEFTDILTESNIANGLFTLQEIRDLYPLQDTSSAYYYVAEQHGYSREVMDKTLKYYYIKKTKKLIEIYDHILGTLSELESLSEKELAVLNAKKANIWTYSEVYSFPETEQSDSGMFEIKLPKKGFYDLSLTATFFPDDKSVKPKVVAYTCHSDSLETGKRKYIETIDFIKDGFPHTYTYRIAVPVKSAIMCTGWLYDYDNCTDDKDRHMRIENISLNFVINTQ